MESICFNWMAHIGWLRTRSDLVEQVTDFNIADFKHTDAKITAGKFTTAQIDCATWTEEMLDMLTEWIRSDPRGEQYRDLDWSHECDLARNGDPDDTQTML